MLTFVATLLLALMTTNVVAQSCPDYYRFVEFGLEDREGIIRRGGPVFRAVSLANRDQLLPQRTMCRDIALLATDGHGHAIPVVTSAAYDPSKIGIGVTSLALSYVDDSASAEDIAAPHLQAVAKAGPAARGDAFLCATGTAEGSLSCQVVSPYTGLPPPVIYCTASDCEMPFMQIDARVSASATWPRDGDAPDETALEILEMVQRLHDFWANPT